MTDHSMMASKMKNENLSTQAIYTSSAKRAKETAEFFSKSFGVQKKDFFTIPRLYHSSPDTILDVISEVDDQYDSVAVFCHNPGITYFANIILDQDIDNIATCGILAMNAEVDSWVKISKDNLKFNSYFYPKM